MAVFSTWADVGLAIGVCGAVAASQAIVTVLFGVSRLDPITYPGMIALLASASLVACYRWARPGRKIPRPVH